MAPTPAHAAPTKLISYQGRITDANGQPLADSTYSIRFKMYTVLASCNTDAVGEVWTETQPTVQVTNGLFSAVLGTVTAFTQDFNSDYYLQVKVGANPVFTPCDRLTASPYAIRAVDANAATNANACNADATCETQAISATGDVTLATGVQIDFFDEVGDKVYWYSNTYGTGIESSTLTNWSSSQFRWRIGGTSVSTGTEKMLLTSTGLTVTDDLTVSGTDIDLIRGDTSYIHSVGRISFDWTAGTYDTPDNHGITSKNEAGSFADALRINSYADIINTIDSNANSVSYFKVQKESTLDGTDLLSIDESGNATLLGDLTVTGGDVSGTATNALACSGDGICDVQTVDSGQGSTEVHLMNQNIRTTDAVTFGELTTGDINIPGSITFGNNRADDGSYEWVGWNSGASRAGIFLWDGIWSGCTATKFCVLGDTHQLMLASNTGNVEINDSVDVTGYVSITGVSDASGNLRFSAANPYISASSYFIAPGGAYFNSGTVYTEAAIQARGGINDDGASAKLDLIDPDGVNITAGPLFMAGTAFCKRYAYSNGGETNCPTSYVAFTLTDGGTNDGNWADAANTGAGRTGYMFCCWAQW